MRSIVVAYVLIVVAPAVAHAEARATPTLSASAANEAVQRKKDGDEAFRSLKYAEALRAYDASYKLVANPALHFNRGRSLEALERYPEALDAFQAFLREASPELRGKAGSLDDHLEELRRKVATLVLSVTPDGARILVRNVAVATSPVASPIRVNAGPARVEVDAEGFVPYARGHDLAGGASTKLSIVLAARPGEGQVANAPTSTATSDRPSQQRPSVFTRWWFWTGAGVVLAGATAAIVVVATGSREPRTGDIGQLNAPLLRF